MIARICLVTTASVRSASRSASVSPTQTIGTSPTAWAARNFAVITASVSP